MKTINEVLYELDPACTSCKENMMYDEYKYVSSGIEESLRSGSSLREAIEENFEFYFMLDSSEYCIEEILNELS